MKKLIAVALFCLPLIASGQPLKIGVNQTTETQQPLLQIWQKGAAQSQDLLRIIDANGTILFRIPATGILPSTYGGTGSSGGGGSGANWNASSTTDSLLAGAAKANSLIVTNTASVGGAASLSSLNVTNTASLKGAVTADSLTVTNAASFNATGPTILTNGVKLLNATASSPAVIGPDQMVTNAVYFPLPNVTTTPTAGAMGANSAWLWQSNAVLYISTSDGENVTTKALTP